MSIHDTVVEPTTAGRRRSSFAKVGKVLLHPFRTSSEVSRSRSNSPASSRGKTVVDPNAKESTRPIAFPFPGDADFPTTEETTDALKAKLQARETQRRETRDREISALEDKERAEAEREEERKRRNEYLLRRDAFFETAEELVPQLKDMDEGEKHDRIKAFRELEKAEAAKQDSLKNREKIRRESFDKKRTARVAQFRRQMEGSIQHSLEKPGRK